MIELDRLTRKFGNFTAVKGISLSVEKGEVLGFLGPNGAGKSTTMKMITGYLAPTSGQVSICGFDVVKKPVEAKSRIGYLPEGAPAWADMTPAGFLDFTTRIRGLSGKDGEKAIAAAIENTNLASVLHQPIDTLSKGFKRRVGLAQALLHNPEVLVLDEPTDGLDPNQKHDVRELIREISADKTIIISTHILEEVEAVCSRAVIIDRGKIVANDTPANLEAQSERHNATVLSFAKGDMEKAEKLILEIDGISKVKREGENRMVAFSKDHETMATQIMDALKKEAIAPTEFLVEQGRLEDVFRAMTYQGNLAEEASQ